MNINGNHSVILKFQPKGIIVKPFQLSIVLSENLHRRLTLLPFWTLERLPSRRRNFRKVLPNLYCSKAASAAILTKIAVLNGQELSA